MNFSSKTLALGSFIEKKGTGKVIDRGAQKTVIENVFRSRAIGSEWKHSLHRRLCFHPIPIFELSHSTMILHDRILSAKFIEDTWS